MWQIKRLGIIGLVLIALNQEAAMGQVTHSPYSIIGLGDQVDLGLPTNQGMAGLGVSNGSFLYFNNVNPALLYYNLYANFSAGILAESKNIQQDVEQDGTTEPYNASNGRLHHFGTALPLQSGKWAMSITLMPYSAVNYNLRYDLPVAGGDTTSIFLNQGEGGINQLNVATGAKVWKGLSIGARAIYYFSSIQKDYSSFVLGQQQPAYIAAYRDRLSFKDFTFGLGVAYEANISSKLKLNVGATYNHSANLKGERFSRVEQRATDNTVLFADTLSNNAPVAITIPGEFAGGISFGIRQPISGTSVETTKLLVGVDFRYQDWTQYQGPPVVTGAFAARKQYILGAEFLPDINSINNYMKRITYRFGVAYEETPYVVNGTHIKDIGINFGWSLPVAQISSLDFGFKFGSRGTLNEGLIREDYFKVYFGATFVDNKWFRRYKYD